MAVTTSKKGNLVDASLQEKTKKVEDIKTNEQKDINNLPEKQEKKAGFLASTIDELKKVEWPKPGYVVRWMFIITVFTAVVSLFLGFFDYLFASSIQFVDCTSPESRAQPLNDCTTEFLQDITFRG